MPISYSGGLQQQGTIDWTRLGGSVVSFSVELLVRLSSGGVESLTVVAAQALFVRLKLSSKGEGRLQEAVRCLRAFSSFNTALWFGFGVKHIVRQLAETSEGLNCIAVCAALQEFYSTTDTARILQEVLASHGPPDRVKPSLGQWIHLTEVCGGALASTAFGQCLSNISNLYLPDGGSEMRLRSQPSAIANALDGLIAVSNGSIERVQFVGGADCAWIAAFAIWLLELPVQIIDVHGENLYFYDADGMLNPKVLIIRGTPLPSSPHLISKSYVIPNGEVLIRGEVGQQVARAGDVLSYGRVPWHSLLRATFGKKVEDLLDGSLTTSFGIALGSAARIFTSVVTDDPDLPENAYLRFRPHWEYLSPSSHGQGFVNTARQCLPELSKPQRLMEATDHALMSTYIDAVAKYEQAMRMITVGCRCQTCARSEENVMALLPPQNLDFCLIILVEVVTDLVQILSLTSHNRMVLPTRAGIENLYWRRWRPHQKRKDYVYGSLLECKAWRILNSAKALYTGRQRDLPNVSAIASNGLCFFLDILVNVSANQEQCNSLHIVPGRIEWSNHLYSNLDDLPHEPFGLHTQHYHTTIEGPISSLSCFNLADSSSSDLRYDLLIEEKGDEGSQSLSAAYRFYTEKGRFLLGPSRLTSDIKTAIETKDCKGRECRPMLPFEVVPVSGEGLMVRDGAILGIDSVPLVVVLSKSVPAQLVALSQDLIFIRSPENGDCSRSVMVKPILQDRQCLHCLLSSAIQGPRGKHSLQGTRSLCIITSL